MKLDFDLTTRAGLLNRWKKQIGERLHRSLVPRPVAAVKWTSRFRSASSLIDIRDLRVTVLYDDLGLTDRPRIRFAAYWVQAVLDGVLFGGELGNRLEKDLARPPRCGARDATVDSSDILMLRTALLLDARLSAAAEDAAARPKRLRIPTLWAGFELAVADRVRGTGPEICGLCHRHGQSSGEILKRFQQTHHSLRLFPFEWCGDHWDQVHAIFADFGGVPRCQVVNCIDGLEELQGYRAASQFDFVSSRFQPRRRTRSDSSRALAVTG